MIGLGAKSRFLQFLKCFWQQKLGKAELAVPFPESPFPRIGKTLALSSGALESGPGVFFGLWSNPFMFICSFSTFVLHFSYVRV